MTQQHACHGTVEVCEGALVAVGGWVLTDGHNLASCAAVCSTCSHDQDTDCSAKKCNAPNQKCHGQGHLSLPPQPNHHHHTHTHTHIHTHTHTQIHTHTHTHVCRWQATHAAPNQLSCTTHQAPRCGYRWYVVGHQIGVPWLRGQALLPHRCMYPPTARTVHGHLRKMEARENEIV